MRQIHLDPLGGIAGDMFVAALLDAFPGFEAATIAAARALTPLACRIRRHQEGHHQEGVGGLRFEVEAPASPAHTSWREIRARIAASSLPEPVQTHAIGIFALLAAAEGKVHGVEPEAVTFHEIGAADSIADILAAAWLIEAVGPASWSVAPLPLGGGQVTTAHGRMPVPAPATALLLEGFALIDDGIGGERVTPTGAAILRYLAAAPPAPGAARRLAASGTGFGARRLPGLANCLRVLVFDDAPAADGERWLGVISFEVDDQSPEDLAVGLERMRALPGVLDALQMPACGKKGRLLAHIQLLVQPDAMEAAAEASFRETTTIGLRTQLVRALALPREAMRAEIEGRSLRVKRVQRPGGPTAKAEIDDVAAVAGQAERARLRQAAAERAGAAMAEAPDGRDDGG